MPNIFNRSQYRGSGWGRESFLLSSMSHLLENQQKGSAEAQDSVAKTQQTGESRGRKHGIAINKEVLGPWSLDFLRDIHWMVTIF